MADQIQILRGTRGEIVAAQTPLLEGQPLYNEDDNYLTIGSAKNSSPSQLPIKVREIGGYFEDEGGLKSTGTSKYFIKPIKEGTEHKLAINSGDKGIKIEASNSASVLSTGYTLVKGNVESQLAGGTVVVGSGGSSESITNNLTCKATNINIVGTSSLNIGATGTDQTFIKEVAGFTFNEVASPFYNAPAGSPKSAGSEDVYVDETSLYELRAIFDNLDGRLDSLGFKGEVVKDSSGSDLLTFSKIGYYVFVTLNQSKTLAYYTQSAELGEVPVSFRRPGRAPSAKTLSSFSASPNNTTARSTFWIQYTNDHKIKIISNLADFLPAETFATGTFNKGSIYAYDMRY